MGTLAIVCGVGCAVFVAALLVFRTLENAVAAGACKVAASTCFVVLGVFSGAGGTTGALLVLALVLCWLGDVLLIPDDAKRAFLLGLVSFLLGHAVFAVLFLVRGIEPPVLGIALVAAGVAGFAILRWLEPHAGSLLWPVRAYVVTILGMVALAAGASAHTGDPRLAVGAVAFAVSDVAVARERFVAPSPWNPRWGLPLYYGAVWLLAASAAGS